MTKFLITLMFTVGCFSTAAHAQRSSFTKNLFEEKSHDFGTIARAAQIDYVFQFKNTTKNNIEVSAVRTSCNCTTPSIEKRVVAPGETGGIRCKFNTRSFLGARRATVTVSFSRPYFTEVQLEVKGYVRRDIVVNPPAIDFKNVKEGVGGSQKVAIEYAGNDDWKITSVASSSPDIEVLLTETHRGDSLVGYELLATLKASAKPGYLNRYQLMLKTNDKRMNEFPISISGKVAAAISISPGLVDLADVKVGESISKRIIVKGSEPFQILQVKSSEDRFSAKIDGATKKLHILPIVFKAGDQAGPIKATVEVVTDKGGPAKRIQFSGTVVK
ncbi:DUF1573 domain-containing protein [Pirellulaceae bacterium]|jgi:hypothetical protein|nr:DUF1573 domain-containing protein [Mariniblastus sp.]MDB4756248.1 DUF1573 domain-containing protein [Mariniblastus sp.]MDB4794199.1 DUF1573 domain-containing protein [Pirellulaceae bacterium]